MIKILFVCHGNICRSPMGEFIMRELVRKTGKEDEFLIESAATSREEVGNDMYPPAKRILAAHGVPFGRREARQVTEKDCQKFDMIILMDDNNVRNFHRMFGNRYDHKVMKLMNFTSQGGNVADPWYTDDFESAYTDISEGCKALLLALENTEQIQA